MSGGLQIERIQDQMRRLRLGRSVEQLPALLEEAARRELAYSDFLEELLTMEISGKHERNTSMRVAMAHFPFVKTLENFEFKFQPSIDAKVVRELATVPLHRQRLRRSPGVTAFCSAEVTAGWVER